LPARAATPCPVCRAMSHLHECDDTDLAHPSTGAVGIVGTVAEAFTGACDRDMTVDVIRSSQAALPRRITVTLGPCQLWNGKPGDTLRIMVDETPSPDGSYRLRACK